jgi:hypothetical protein
VLNVNQRHEAKQAHQALVRAAKALTQQALNSPLPKTGVSADRLYGFEQFKALGRVW